MTILEGWDGRVSVWVHPSIPLEFLLEEETPPPLNREWLEQLMDVANRSGELRITAEPAAEHASIITNQL